MLDVTVGAKSFDLHIQFGEIFVCFTCAYCLVQVNGEASY